MLERAKTADGLFGSLARRTQQTYARLSVLEVGALRALRQVSTAGARGNSGPDGWEREDVHTRGRRAPKP
jgi:hypothetical protein